MDQNAPPSSQSKLVEQYRITLEKQLELASPSQQPLISEFCEELEIALEEIQLSNQALLGASKTLDAERQRYRDLFDFAPDAYLVTTFYGSILEANHAAAALLGVDKVPLVSKPLTVFIPQKRRSTFRRFLFEIQESFVVQTRKLLIQTRGRSPFPALVQVSAVRDPIDQSLTFRWMIRDISKQVQQELKLRRSLDFAKSLQKITEQLVMSLDATEVLHFVVSELTDVLGLAGCNIGIYNLEQQTSTIEHECVGSGELSRGQVVSMDAFPVGYHQLLQGQMFQFCNLDNAEPCLLGIKAQANVATLACPIRDRQTTFGDLWLSIPQGDCLDAAEVEFVRQVALQCAIAIRQSRLQQSQP